MIRRPFRALWSLSLVTRSSLALLALTAVGAAQGSELDVFVRRKMAEAHTPGLAAAIVKQDQLVWLGAYGLRDVQRALPVLPETPFMLASISKAITGTALMQLFEEGRFRLDDDIDASLPFVVDHPTWPTVPITFRALLSHVAGIQDNWSVMVPLYSRGDSPLRLGYFLEQYLVPGGEWFYHFQNFTPFPPEVGYRYSNIGFALNGYLVESISGVPFDKRCTQEIFTPLGMHDTSWRVADFARDVVAMPHGFDSQSGTYKPYYQYGYPDYPDGTLRCSVLDLSRFLLAHMNGGEIGGARILEAATVAEMQTVQYPHLDGTQGLAFYYWNFNGWTLLGHAGGDQGVYTEMWFRPEDGVGVVLLSNGDASIPVMFEVLQRLFEEGAAL